MSLYEIYRELAEHVVSVLRFLAILVAFKHHLFFIPPDKRRIVIVSGALVQESKPFIESLFVRLTGSIRFTQSPLACHPRNIASFL